jgi:pyruvate dehydrogenase E1 component
MSLAAVPTDPAARERRRRHVLAGAYALRRSDKRTVTIAVMGAVVPEALSADGWLAAQGYPADVICIT